VITNAIRDNVPGAADVQLADAALVRADNCVQYEIATDNELDVGDVMRCLANQQPGASLRFAGGGKLRLRVPLPRARSRTALYAAAAVGMLIVLLALAVWYLLIRGPSRPRRQ